MNPTRPDHRRSRSSGLQVRAIGRGLALALVVMLAAAVPACIDTSEPDWFMREGAGTSDVEGGATITGVKDGQRCTMMQDNPPDDSLRLHFIDVGQGDAIWIQSPTGENVLLDAGDGGFFGRSEGGVIVENYLTDHGLPAGSTLDAAIVSHAHSDHYGGFDKLFTRYFFDKYIDPGLDTDGSAYNTLLEAAELRLDSSDFHRPAIGPNGIVEMRGARMSLFGSEVDAWMLAAEERIREGEDNNAKINNTSIVIRLEFAGRSVLLTGDIHSEIERELVAIFGPEGREPSIRTNILKVAHHGSNSSSTILDALFEGVPEEERWSIIMAGRLSFGHEDAQLPDQETVYKLFAFMGQQHVFSTEADDAGKEEAEAAGDDHILGVINPDGSMYVCYRNL